MKNSSRLRGSVNLLLWVLFSAVFAVHLTAVIYYSVDVPHMDSWEQLRQATALNEFNIGWLTSAHNEHRILLTRLMTLISYQLTNWDVSQVIVFNFLLYGVLVLSLGYLMRACAPDLPNTYIPLTLLFLLSTSANENHLWDFQNQIHGFLLFAIWAAILLLSPGNSVAGTHSSSWPKTFAGIVLAWLSIYSFAAGFFMIAAVLACFLLHEFVKGRLKGIINARSIITTAAIAVGLLWFLSEYRPVQHDTLPSHRIMPWQHEFWYFWINMISSGFGYQKRTAGPAVIAAIFVLTPIVYLIKTRGRFNPSAWPALCIAAGTLLNLVVVTFSRGAFGLWASKSSRYMEFASILLPVTVALIWNVQWTKRTRHLWLGTLLLFTAIGYRNDWQFVEAYEGQRNQRLRGLACLRKYYEGEGSAHCPDTYPKPAPEVFDNARLLRVSFYRKLMSDQYIEKP